MFHHVSNFGTVQFVRKLNNVLEILVCVKDKLPHNKCKSVLNSCSGCTHEFNLKIVLMRRHLNKLVFCPDIQMLDCAHEKCMEVALFLDHLFCCL